MIKQDIRKSTKTVFLRHNEYILRCVARLKVEQGGGLGSLVASVVAGAAASYWPGGVDSCGSVFGRWSPLTSTSWTAGAGRRVTASAWRHRAAQTGQVPAEAAATQRKWKTWEHSATKVASPQLAVPASPPHTPQRTRSPVLAMEPLSCLLPPPPAAMPCCLLLLACAGGENL